MSVLACNRTGCENVMCDRYSSEYGYICWECFNELVESGAETNIKEFMNKPKVHKNKAAALARFEFEFPEWRDEDEK